MELFSHIIEDPKPFSFPFWSFLDDPSWFWRRALRRGRGGALTRRRWTLYLSDTLEASHPQFISPSLHFLFSTIPWSRKKRGEITLSMVSHIFILLYRTHMHSSTSQHRSHSNQANVNDSCVFN